jgi:glycosyltransferase involved in cell wall biosynthesis
VDLPVPSGALDRWRARIGWDASRRTIGIIARLKDQAVVLRALDQVATPVRLVLAGVGEHSGLDELVSRVPPRHDVVRLPFDPEVRPLYDLLDVVLLPSRIEGLSQSLLEAMALGKPVIASAAAGNRDLITDRVDGLLVEPLEPAAWARALEEILADPATASRLAAAARHTARERHSLDRTVNTTAQLYRALLGSS